VSRAERRPSASVLKFSCLGSSLARGYSCSVRRVDTREPCAATCSGICGLHRGYAASDYLSCVCFMVSGLGLPVLRSCNFAHCAAIPSEFILHAGVGRRVYVYPPVHT
jgi:hypothetical protein